MKVKVSRKQIGIYTVILSLSALLIEPIRTNAATSSGSTTINATVAATISLSTSTTVGLSLVPTTGGVVTSAGDTVTVNTNNSTGYTLTMTDANAVTSLASGGNTIPAHTGTQASPTALAANTWGYRVVNVGGFGATAYSAETNNASSTSTWAGVPALGSPNTLKTTATTATNDVTTVWYGVRATTAKPSGVYTGVVTYTAVTN
ncbi:hypothetical protein A3E76_05150 [Candidatus Saccharibacteria bacterium RIFCSPHIGHO2_12_FULL_44_22]|nr:MAG: hypothetical protein A3E76_05150 [Candidatus Saccharibacteria bacterium RIFCSPHIGHO2_12_FULL_44_22]